MSGQTLHPLTTSNASPVLRLSVVPGAPKRLDPASSLPWIAAYQRLVVEL